jgi:hypothetical protein
MERVVMPVTDRISERQMRNTKSGILAIALLVMRRLILALVLVLTVVVAPVHSEDTSTTVPSQSQITETAADESTALRIFGFGDLLATFRDETDGRTFDVGQAEVDMEGELTDRLAMSLAIAYDEGSFGIGALTVDYSAWFADESRPPMLGIENVTVGGGQFDVPFGIDYHVYPSIDRKLVSSPLIVENTHDSWNDYGAYVLA